MGCSILCKIFESFLAEINILPAKIETKMSPDVFNTSKATVFQILLYLPVSSDALSTTTHAEAANNEMKLQLSLRDDVKVVNLTHSTELSMPKIVPVRRISEPTIPNGQLDPQSCPVDHQAKQI
ncbi:hypothetical protein ACTXT7_003280 [Hymenolepis weldensis]